MAEDNAERLLDLLFTLIAAGVFDPATKLLTIDGGASA